MIPSIFSKKAEPVIPSVFSNPLEVETNIDLLEESFRLREELCNPNCQLPTQTDSLLTHIRKIIHSKNIVIRDEEVYNELFDFNDLKDNSEPISMMITHYLFQQPRSTHLDEILVDMSTFKFESKIAQLAEESDINDRNMQILSTKIDVFFEKYKHHYTNDVRIKSICNLEEKICKTDKTKRFYFRKIFLQIIIEDFDTFINILIELFKNHEGITSNLKEGNHSDSSLLLINGIAYLLLDLIDDDRLINENKKLEVITVNDEISVFKNQTPININLLEESFHIRCIGASLNPSCQLQVPTKSDSLLTSIRKLIYSKHIDITDKAFFYDIFNYREAQEKIDKTFIILFFLERNPLHSRLCNLLEDMLSNDFKRKIDESAIRIDKKDKNIKLLFSKIDGFFNTYNGDYTTKTILIYMIEEKICKGDKTKRSYFRNTFLQIIIEAFDQVIPIIMDVAKKNKKILGDRIIYNLKARMKKEKDNPALVVERNYYSLTLLFGISYLLIDLIENDKNTSSSLQAEEELLKLI